MSEIKYDPACRDCRADAGKPNAGTTWQCSAHGQRERDSLRVRLAELEGQILAWWSMHRPVAFTVDDHVRNPLVNTNAEPESARGVLALTACEIAKSPNRGDAMSDRGPRKLARERRPDRTTVKTGGEMGQILDHLLCASDPRIRMQDARDALAYAGKLEARIAELEAEVARLRALTIPPAYAAEVTDGLYEPWLEAGP